MNLLENEDKIKFKHKLTIEIELENCISKKELLRNLNLENDFLNSFINQQTTSIEIY